MTVEDLIRVVPILAFLVLQGIEQTFAEDCGNNIHCFSPYVCCTNLQTCCYDRDSQNSFRHNYKLHLWNMWYFWFVIIFILMSCFGGCGYYRRRRLAALDQHRRSAITTRRPQYGRGSTRVSQSYLAYVGPAATDPPEISFLPPPYSEVVNQPGMYPDNKGDLPPYPGPPVIQSNYAANMPPPTLSSPSAQGLAPTSGNMPKPPPYSQFADPAPRSANQDVSSRLTTNQETSIPQPADQLAQSSQATNDITQISQAANQEANSTQANENTETSANQCSPSDSNPSTH